METILSQEVDNIYMFHPSSLFTKSHELITKPDQLRNTPVTVSSDQK